MLIVLYISNSQHSYGQSKKKFNLEKIYQSKTLSKKQLTISFSGTEISTGIRHKNNDITHRGSTQISDYLPVPAPLYRLNNSNFNQLNANNINLEDEEVQTTGGSTEYYSDDISDLANPAVAAISNLKTVPPVSLQRINMKTIASIIPEIMYTKGNFTTTMFYLILTNID